MLRFFLVSLYTLHNVQNRLEYDLNAGQAISLKINTNFLKRGWHDELKTDFSLASTFYLQNIYIVYVISSSNIHRYSFPSEHKIQDHFVLNILHTILYKLCINPKVAWETIPLIPRKNSHSRTWPQRKKKESPLRISSNIYVTEQRFKNKLIKMFQQFNSHPSINHCT